MAPKGGTVFFLLIVASSASAKPLEMIPGTIPDFKYTAKKLMMQCQNKGYQLPDMTLLNTVFNNSDLPVEDRTAHPSNTFLSTFLDVLNVVASDTKIGSLNSVPMDDSNKMPNKMWNCTNLPNIIRLMRNSSDSSACYMKAFVAPLSWTILTTQGENNVALDDYDTLLWAARPALQEMPSSRIALPTRVESQHLKKMMKLLQDVYEPLPENQRAHVVNWAKEQISQNYFNCTTQRPSSDSNSKHPELCKPSLQWLNLEALTIMGPYLSHLTPEDVDSCPMEKLCEFFQSGQFNSILSRVTNINPTLGKKFLQRIQECFNGKNEFAQHVDKLGALASVASFLSADNNSDYNNSDMSNTDNGSIIAEALPTDMTEKVKLDNICWTTAQLTMMTNDTFVATVETLGAIPDYNADQLAVLSKKAIQAFGPVSKMTETVVMQIGCITQGFSNSDLETLPLSLDTVIEISKCHWNESKIRPVWKAVAKYNNLTAQHLGAAEIAALGQILCGLNSSEMEQLNTTALSPMTTPDEDIAASIISGLDSEDLSIIDNSIASFVNGLISEPLPPVTSHINTEVDSFMAPVQAQIPNKSGAPSLSVKGILNLMKAFPFLLMGLLLL
ncbi:uncharacterized protein LOC113136499 isoform X2 [Mastacembelus armatus]|uniref:uncharacterized protein LOC113136499 isoform X2 n=1 Tax=Mastacembelus armatus TaxID=205130 RepID=UPI000E4584D4|nr:otoancorin isoform X2 [Mastacembelus armatus]